MPEFVTQEFIEQGNSKWGDWFKTNKDKSKQTKKRTNIQANKIKTKKLLLLI